MRKTDARIFYLEDTVPYKEGYLTIQVYESNEGMNSMDTLEIDITVPPKEGSEIRLSKHIKVKFNE
tara:strand:- start:262 stop:459 length:198 start_codon:yes stop_codon:yes gene_type:complete